MRSSPPADLPSPCLRCPRCFQHGAGCLCDRIPTIATRTRFLIVRHIAEEHRSSNTARVAALALTNSELLAYGGGAPFDEAPLRAPGTWLLYPGFRDEPCAEPPRAVVVLDGTWRQARRMLLKIEALRSLPRLSLVPPAIAPPRLREPPRPDGMSTIEAIAGAVRKLEGDALASPLDVLFSEMVQRGLELRGRRTG